jgi:hypothetical protein
MPLVLHGKDVSAVHDSETPKIHGYGGQQKTPPALIKKGNGAFLKHRSITPHRPRILRSLSVARPHVKRPARTYSHVGAALWKSAFEPSADGTDPVLKARGNRDKAAVTK